MILAPSPQTLLHKKNPNYVMSLMSDCSIPDCLRSFDNDSSPKQGSPQPFIDLCFLTSGGENPKIRHSSYNSAFILHYVLKTMNPSVSLLFAQLALQVGDTEEAINFLIESAKNGSTHAMVLIGYLYFNFKNIFFSTVEQSKKESLKWILRAMKNGSEQSNFLLGEILSSFEHNQNPLINNSTLLSTYFYAKFVKFNKSVSTSTRVVNNFYYLLQRNKIQSNDITFILHKLLLYIVSQGERTGLLYIYRFYQNNAEMMKIWGKMIIKYFPAQEKAEKNDLIEKAKKGVQKEDFYNLDLLNEEYQFSDKMAASFDENISIYSTRVLSQLLSSVDPFKSFKTSVFILQRYPPDSNGPKISHIAQSKYEDEQRLKSDLSININIRDGPDSVVNDYLNVSKNADNKNYHNFTNLDPSGLPINAFYHSNGFNEKMSGFYPNKNKTWLLLQLFEYVSPKPEKRNIIFASQIIYQIYNENRHGIVDSRLWQAKIKSKKQSDQIKCGFICLILKDVKSAFILFQRASMQGNSLGSLMCGLLLFHNDVESNNLNNLVSTNETENLVLKGRKEALSFFLRCSDDPIALLHLYLVFNDNYYYDRAVSLIGIVGNQLNRNNPSQQAGLNDEIAIEHINDNNNNNSTIGVRNLNENYAPFEIVGDIFYNGIKFVQNLKIARAFYAAAIDRAYKDDVSCLNLLAKFDSTQSS